MIRAFGFAFALLRFITAVPAAADCISTPDKVCVPSAPPGLISDPNDFLHQAEEWAAAVGKPKSGKVTLVAKTYAGSIALLPNLDPGACEEILNTLGPRIPRTVSKPMVFSVGPADLAVAECVK